MIIEQKWICENCKAKDRTTWKDIEEGSQRKDCPRCGKQMKENGKVQIKETGAIPY